MDNNEFLKYLRERSKNNLDIVANSDIEGFYRDFGIDIIEATRAALSLITGMVRRNANIINIERNRIIFMKEQEIIWEDRLDPYSEEDKTLIEALFEAHRLGFENLLKLDNTISENIAISYENDRIICKYI